MFSRLVVGIVIPVVIDTKSIDPRTNYKIWPLPKSFEAGEHSFLCRLDKGFRYSISGVSAVSGHVTNVKAAVGIRNAQLQKLFGFGKHPPRSSTYPPCGVKRCELRVKSLLAGLTHDTASESYAIEFNAQGCSISCPTVYGCMHGMVTLTQMVDPVLGFRMPSAFLISDEPAYPHRGILLDTSRHYMPEGLIMEMLELMGESKVNVLHWHLVDDHSFPLVLDKYPELAEKGAYSPQAVYTEECVSRVLAKAGSLGIKVIPEVDIPGHTWSWFKSHPELEGNADGAIDPSRPENYVWLRSFLHEIVLLFSHPTRVSNELLEVHLGSDETWNAWDTPEISQWMIDEGIESKSELVKYWFHNIMDPSVAPEYKPIIWEDFVAKLTPEDLATLSETFTWQFWSTLDLALINGFTASSISTPIIYSSAFYLDTLEDDWADLYRAPFPERSMGSEACMWSEWVDESNIISRTWPRTAALGERLWIGGTEGGNPGAAVVRLAKWRCRMVHIFGHSRVEPVGRVRADNPETVWTWHTDKTQWWCDEAEL